MDNSGINYTDATRSGRRQFVLDETPTLRDWFAMASLNKLISDNDGLRPDVIANLAYTIADQMLEARK